MLTFLSVGGFLFATLGPSPVRAQYVTATVAAGSAPQAVAVNPVTNQIYVANSNSANVTVIDGATNIATSTVAAGTVPYAIAVNPVTNMIYVANFNSANVTVINGATNATTTVAAGTTPYAIALNPVTNKIYVANAGGNSVTVIDGATNVATATVTVGTYPDAIAVNPVTNQIYAANYIGDNVTVIDGGTNTVTATVPVGSQPGAIAVNPVTNQIYVGNINDSTVTVINGATNIATAAVSAGTYPNAIAFNPVTGQIYVANQGSGNVTVINGATNIATATVTAGSQPWAVAVNPVTNKIYVSNRLDANVTVIDGATNAAFNLGVGVDPVAIAINPVTNKIYAGNSGTGSVTVIDGATNATGAVPETPSPSAVAVNPVTNQIYVADYMSANVTAVDGATNATTTLASGTNPYSVAVNPATNQIYVANYGSANVTVVDGATNTVTATVAAGTNPISVTVNPVTNQIYVANNGSSNVTVIDGATNATTTVTAGTNPWAVAVNPVTNQIYVANNGSANVTVIDGATNATATVAAGSQPIGVVVNPVSNKIYVANAVSNNVTVIDGATNATVTVAAGNAPNAIDVNPVTNKVYVANFGNANVTVIDGATNTPTTVTTQSFPYGIAANPVTNKIYVANYTGNNVTVIDGATNTTTTVTAGSLPETIAVNPVTNKIYVANFGSLNNGNLTVITEQKVQAVPLSATITPLAGNQTNSATPSFTFNAQSTFSPTAPTPQNVFFQMDTWRGPWTQATNGGSSFSGTTASMLQGFHILYAYADDGQDATSVQAGSPLIGNLTAYGFLVTPSISPTPTPTPTATPTPTSAPTPTPTPTPTSAPTPTPTSTPTPTATPSPTPSPTPQSGPQIYVINQNNEGMGTVGEYNADGSTVNASLIAGINNAGGIAASGGNLFVTSLGDSAVYEYNFDGTPAHSPMTALISGLTWPGGILVSGGQIFISETNRPSIDEYNLDGTVVHVPLVPGETLTNPYCLAVSGGQLYVADLGAGTVGEYNVSDGSAVNASLISGLDHPFGVAISGGQLYVACNGHMANDGTISEYNLNGTPVQVPLVSGLNKPCGITISAGEIYVANVGNSTVGEYNLNGTPVNASLISELNGPIGVIVVAAQGPTPTPTPTSAPTPTPTQAPTPTPTPTLSVGPVAYLSVNAPSLAFVGYPFSVTVSAYDGNGNLVTNFSGKVFPNFPEDSYSLSYISGASLPLPATLTNGTGSFQYTFNSIPQPPVPGFPVAPTFTVYTSDLDHFGVSGVVNVQKYEPQRYPSSPLGNFAPSIGEPPLSATIIEGRPASFSAVGVGGTPGPTFQWQESTDGGSTWANLGDTGVFGGTATATLSISATTISMSSDQFRIVATNSLGAATSAPATLTVTFEPVGESLVYDFTTLAGTAGQAGSSDGTGSAARFAFPAGVAADSAGYVYVADTGNHTIRKISPGGVVTTLAGLAGQAGSADGQGSAGRFSSPQGVAVDGVGNVYVADTANYTVRAITSSGDVFTLAGFPGTYGEVDGDTSIALFEGPQGVTVDGNGNVYVADTGGLIRLISGLYVSTIAGSMGQAQGSYLDGPGSGARFAYLCGLAASSTGTVYVADTFNSSLRKVQYEAFDGQPQWVVSTLLGGPGSTVPLYNPGGAAVDAQGNVFVSDTYNQTIIELSNSGVATTVGGTLLQSGSADGAGTMARFSGPSGVAVDSAGNIYVADTYNHTIRKGVPRIQFPFPTIVAQPASQVVDFLASATFSVIANGNPAPTYQWTFNGAAIPGATGASYSILLAQPSKSGSYAVNVTNPAGSVTSQSAFLTVTAVSGGPSITSQPSSFTSTLGSTMVFSVGAVTGPTLASGSGSARVTDAVSPFTYQWYLDGNVLVDGDGISGSQTATLLLIGRAAIAGSYSCLILNAAGSILSQPASLSTRPTVNPGRLINVSCRGLAGTGASSLITGFVVGGNGTSGSKPVLVRASGPALAPFGVPETLPDPVLQLFGTASGGSLLATNDSWGGATSISGYASILGAFAWKTHTSHDAALLESLPAGPYTANVSGASGDAGIALAEVYDAAQAGFYTISSPRLINISARSMVGSGSKSLIAGFVIGGFTAKTVLIRAAGPALSAFAVAGILPDPELQLFRSNADGTSALLQSNTGWGGSSQVASIAVSVGAFDWGTSATPDSAILVTLPPGAYTAQISGASGDTGIALVEVYDVP